MTTFVDIHLIQSVPPSCINRDDTGSPKTAIVGGVKRHRVSSQAWKKATRDEFKHLLPADKVGIRTKRIVKVLADEIKLQNPELAEEALTLAAACFAAGGVKVIDPKRKGNDSDEPIVPESGYLFFISTQQIEALAKLAIESKVADLPIDKKEAKLILKSFNSVDLALFGRMVADAPELNVDAACQVAHAISTHRVQTESDYFTALDEEKARTPGEDAGAGMIGQVEFVSSTLYRYATVNVDALISNLGSDTVAFQAISAFIAAFVRSMPTGKQNTFANRTLPEAVLVQVREDQPLSLASAFERAVRPGIEGGYSTSSVKELVNRLAEIQDAFDLEAVETLAVGTGEFNQDELERVAQVTTLKNLVRLVVEVLSSRFPEES